MQGNNKEAREAIFDGTSSNSLPLPFSRPLQFSLSISDPRASVEHTSNGLKEEVGVIILIIITMTGTTEPEAGWNSGKNGGYTFVWDPNHY